jgi:hypothetical protein
MKNILLLLFLSITLFSCKVYKETYVLEKYPIEWYDEIVIPSEHFHYKDDSSRWKCFYYEPDTVCWHYVDTIQVCTLIKVEKVKRSVIK